MATAESRPSATPRPRTTPLPRPREGHGFRRILACLDGSAHAEVCLPHAVFLSRVFGAKVTLLYVMQPPVSRSGAQTTDALGWEISRQQATAYLGRKQREIAAACEQLVDVRLEQGHPAERIIGVGRELAADLTLLGSHGEGGLTAWSLGGTAQQVLAVSRASVHVVRSTSATPTVISPRRILVPLDGSRRTESVLPTVARIALAHGAEVLLVHVVPEPLPSALLQDAGDLALAQELANRLERRATSYLDGIRDQLARDVASVRAIVLRHADERQSLLELIQREGVDLVVLSAHGSTCNPARTFGSVAAHMLSHGVVPLLVLQDLPESERRLAPEGAEQLAPPLRTSHPPAAL
jgi:nucleotide-binding universal stress UspA family protein